MTCLSRHIVTLAGCLTVTVNMDVHANTFFHLWSQRFGSSAEQYGFSVATDASGSVIITGQFEGTVNFGGGNLTSAGQNDIFLAKFNSSGIHQWSMRFGDANFWQHGYSVATDAGGNVIVTGGFDGTVNFGGGNLTSSSGQDIFVAKFNAGGVHQWSQRFGSGGDQVGTSVTTDKSGNVIVTGFFTGFVDFGGGPLNGAGTLDIFIVKFNSSGIHQWSQRFGDSAFQRGYSVSTDEADNVLVTGYFDGTVDFGGGVLTSEGGHDIFLAKFDSDGLHKWSRGFGFVYDQFGTSVATDKGGNVFITGYFLGTVNFGGGYLENFGGYDTFLAKFNSSGTHQWSKRFGNQFDQLGQSLATEEDGNVVIAGHFAGAADFGGGTLTSAGSDDIFLAKFDSGGGHLSSSRFGDANVQRCFSVTTDATGNTSITGWFTGVLNFGGADFLTAGGGDIFLAKFSGSPGEPVITSVVDIGNDQGRKVKIRFGRSGTDDRASPSPVVRYDVFRRDDPAPATAANTRSKSSQSGRDQRAEGWTYVGSSPAFAEESYGIDVPTIGDSTITFGQYYSVFYIRAATKVSSVFHDSAPDSGYSLDNLAPAVPTSFAYVAGFLTWHASEASDFGYFSVYGGSTNSFAETTLIDYTISPTMSLAAPTYRYYFVTATDASGNEGRPALTHVWPGPDDPPKRYVLSISSYPNPFNPETTIRYTVPSRGRVTLSIYDARGLHIATLMDDNTDAGTYTKTWNGSDSKGSHVGSGVYFARIQHPSGTRSYKLLLLK